jgi:hypothetical protein
MSARTKAGHSSLRLALAAAALALAGAGGCSSTDEFLSGQPPAPSGSSQSFVSRFRTLFGGGGQGTEVAVAQAQAQTPEAAQNCPPTDIRQGASTLQMTAPGADNAMAVRYQATFSRTARQCAIADGNLSIKVGVQGRLILGPAGVSGDTTVPLRYALVREGVEPKTIWSKLYLVPVAVPAGQVNVPFTHVIEDMVVPMPGGVEFDAYVIYVGFDPQGAAQEKPQKKPQRGQAQKPRAGQ